MNKQQGQIAAAPSSTQQQGRKPTTGPARANDTGPNGSHPQGSLERAASGRNPKPTKDHAQHHPPAPPQKAQRSHPPRLRGIPTATAANRAVTPPGPHQQPHTALAPNVTIEGTARPTARTARRPGDRGSEPAQTPPQKARYQPHHGAHRDPMTRPNSKRRQDQTAQRPNAAPAPATILTGTVPPALGTSATPHDHNPARSRSGVPADHHPQDIAISGPSSEKATPPTPARSHPQSSPKRAAPRRAPRTTSGRAQHHPPAPLQKAQRSHPPRLQGTPTTAAANRATPSPRPRQQSRTALPPSDITGTRRRQLPGPQCPQTFTAASQYRHRR